MGRLKNYSWGIAFLFALLFSTFSCKQEQKSQPKVEAVETMADTIITPVKVIPVEVVDGLHIRLEERLPKEILVDSSFLDFKEWLRFEKETYTLLLPTDGKVLEWKDQLLPGHVDSPMISKELNGLRSYLPVKSIGESQWNFTRRNDSLIVTDISGSSYWLWQTDIKATNGILHILKRL